MKKRQLLLSHKVYRMVEDQANPYAILQIAGIDSGKVYSYTFESCSFVVGMTDMKTCHEICFFPEGQTIWIEPENPVFKIQAGIHRLGRN